jgi:hypothetical protein
MPPSSQSVSPQRGLDSNAIGLEDAQLLADPTVNEEHFAFLHFDDTAEPASLTGERRFDIGVKSEKTASKPSAIGLEIVAALAYEWSLVKAPLSAQTVELGLGRRDHLGFNLEKAFRKCLGLIRGRIERVIDAFHHSVELNHPPFDLLLSGENLGDDARERLSRPRNVIPAI